MRFFNTASGIKEEFSKDSKNLGLYICGPTVYSETHLGHAKSYVSFDILKNPNKEKFLNYLILINIFSSAKNQSSLKVNYFNPKIPDDTKYFQAKRNSFTIKNLNFLEKQINNCETLFFTSSQCLFIPLTLSINIETQHLSLEHTHPPTELFFGENKFESIKIIKQQWI